MQFIKRNYEKILLAVVLSGLVVVSLFLLFMVSNEKQRLEDLRGSITSRTPKPLQPVDLSAVEAVVKQAATPLVLSFSDSTHKIFNPERWQRPANAPPNTPLTKNPPGSEWLRLEVTRINPLYFTVSLESVNTNDVGVRYGIGVEDQSASKASSRGKRTSYASKGEKKEYNDKKDYFIIQDVQGPPENPSALVLEVSDSPDRILVSKEKPFRRVDGYLADLKYPPENNRTFSNRRANDPVYGKILVAGEEYNVVNITENEVVLLAKNQKKWTIKFNAGP